MAEKGFEDTPVSEIVPRASSSVGAFYARFDDKDALLHALAVRFVDQAMATADAALDPTRWEGAQASEDPPRRRPLPGVDLPPAERDHPRLRHAQPHVDPEFRARQDRLSHYVSTSG